MVHVLGVPGGRARVHAAGVAGALVYALIAAWQVNYQGALIVARRTEATQIATMINFGAMAMGLG
jgi:hypothetical protein